jgi:hypothetical protein
VRQTYGNNCGISWKLLQPSLDFLQREQQVKILVVSLLLSISALGQTPVNGKLITFDRADAEHCKVVVVGGKPLLESTYGGTSVAIAMPMNNGRGEFLVFVAISQIGTGAVKVNPKDFYGLYSDSAHSRFAFYDKAAEMERQIRGQVGDPGLSAANAQVDPGSLRPGQEIGGGPPAGAGPPVGGSSGEGGPSGGAPPTSAGTGTGAPIPVGYLHRGNIKQGGKIVGWVVLRQAKRTKLDVHSTDMLDEVDIPVNSVVFRF